MTWFLWIKALHVVAVISWMAGLLYLPRLFVYHSDSTVGSEQSETFKIMERKLFRFIMNPAMIIAWVSGVTLAWLGEFYLVSWFLLKLLFVIGLSGIHGFLGKEMRFFEVDVRRRSARFFRLLNEVPTIMMIGIVIFVIVKPF